MAEYPLGNNIFFSIRYCKIYYNFIDFKIKFFSLLVGSGALTWAKEMGIQCIPPENLISGNIYKFLILVQVF
jgi:hypothetical protein